MNTFIETPRLLIKPPDKIDFEAYYGLLSDPEVMRYIGKGMRTREEVWENLENQIKHFNKHGFSLGFVYEKQTGLFIGRAGLVYLEMKDDQPAIEIGYALHHRFWNRGYSTELVKACVHWGFQNLPVKQLLAVIHPDNERSRRVLERAGMRYWGRKQCYQAEVAQFFIMRKFKRQGIGRQVAYQCFDRFPGIWKVMVFPGNEGSYRFWRTVIKHYSVQSLIEYTRQIAHFKNKAYNIFKFKTGKNR